MSCNGAKSMKPSTSDKDKILSLAMEGTGNPTCLKKFPKQRTIQLKPEEIKIVNGVIKNQIIRKRTGMCCFCNLRKASLKLFACEDSKCLIEFHFECAVNYGYFNYQFQYNMMTMVDKKALCPLHYCNAHLARCDLKSAKGSPDEIFLQCLLCLRAWHDCCQPVGMTLLKDRNGKKWLLCDRHIKTVYPAISHTRKLPFCLDCDFERQGDPLHPCSSCPRQMHSFCYDISFPSPITFDDPILKKCPSCTRGVFATINKACWYLDGDSICIGVPRRWSDVSIEEVRRREKAGYAVIEKLSTKYTLAHQYVIVPANLVVEFQKKHFKFYSQFAKDNEGFQSPHGIQKIINDLERLAYEERKHLEVPTFQAITENDWSRFKTVPYGTTNLKCDCKKDTHCGSECKLWKNDVLCKPECARRNAGCSNQVSLISDSDTEVKGTEDRGMGLFAKKNFKAGDRIVRFLGEVLNEKMMTTHEEIARKSLCREYSNYQLIMTSKTHHIQPLIKGNNGRFSNHSHEPNSAYKRVRVPQPNGKYLPEMIIVALKDINVGDEITISYGPEYYMKMCLCGKASCDTLPGGEWDVSRKKPGHGQPEPQTKERKVQRAQASDPSTEEPVTSQPPTSQPKVKKVTAAPSTPASAPLTKKPVTSQLNVKKVSAAPSAPASNPSTKKPVTGQPAPSQPKVKKVTAATSAPASTPSTKKSVTGPSQNTRTRSVQLAQSSAPPAKKQKK